MKLARIAALAALGLTAAALVGVGLPEQASGLAEQPSSHVITVNGSGAVETIPDRAEFAFGVVTQAATASAALSANSAQTRRVIAALKAAGVADDDIQTQQVSLSPRYSDSEALVGYTAENTVSARIRSLARAGAIVDAAVAAGANNVWGPSLSRSDQTELYRTALRRAVDDARAKAQALAAAGGVTLGGVTAVVEGGSAPMPVAERSSDAAASPPIEAGTQQVEAMVTVTFAIGG